MGHPVVEISYCTLEEQIRTFEHFFLLHPSKSKDKPCRGSQCKDYQLLSLSLRCIFHKNVKKNAKAFTRICKTD